MANVDIKRICPVCGAPMGFVDYSDETAALDSWWVCESDASHRVDHYGDEPLPPVAQPAD